MGQRAITRKLEAAKGHLGLGPKAPIPKGTRLPMSHNRAKATLRVGKSPLRVADIRQGFLHKTSTRLCRENQALGVETLSVAGMMKNRHRAQAIADQGLGAILHDAAIQGRPLRHANHRRRPLMLSTLLSV